MKITSVNNDLIKETAKLLKSKYRKETGLFLIEGEKGVKEALEAGIELERIFVSDTEVIKNTDFDSLLIIETTEAVLSKISDTQTPPKLIAVAHQPKHSKKELKNYNKVVLLEGIKDAGNLGTILRSASAFGVDGIVLFGDTVDLYNPKCVRSTVGCLWKTPVFEIKDFEELKDIFLDFEKIATLPQDTNVVCLDKFTPSEKTLIMFGSEANGLSKLLKDFATKNLTIEMNSIVESLNLSVSASIVMYKLSMFKV